MNIVAEVAVACWVLHCSHCEAEVYKSVPIAKPKHGDALAYQQWFHMDDSPTKLDEPYVCRTCCKWFQPMVESLSMKRRKIQ